MKVEKYEFNHWSSTYPMYRCKTFADYRNISKWMYNNDVKYFLWSSGSGGYIFDVRKNQEWFKLKWS